MIQLTQGVDLLNTKSKEIPRLKNLFLLIGVESVLCNRTIPLLFFKRGEKNVLGYR